MTTLTETTTSQRLNLRALTRDICFPPDGFLHFAMEYPAKLPDSIPDGLVLVHNRVRPARKQGTRGFRFWLQSPVSELDRCPCRWAAELGQHHTSARRSA